MQFDLFGSFIKNLSGRKFSLGKGILFPKFTSCFWPYARWPCFAFLTTYLSPPKSKGISFPVLRTFELTFSEENLRFPISVSEAINAIRTDISLISPSIWSCAKCSLSLKNSVYDWSALPRNLRSLTLITSVKAFKTEFMFYIGYSPKDSERKRFYFSFMTVMPRPL